MGANEKRVKLGLPTTKDKHSDKETLYKNLRRRAKTKSEHKYVSKEKKPVLLRLELDGSLFDSTVEFLVKYGSFNVLYGEEDATGEKPEIGFTVNIYDVGKKEYILTAMKKSGKVSYKKIKKKGKKKN